MSTWDNIKKVRRGLLSRYRLAKMRLTFCDIKVGKDVYIAPHCFVSRKHKVRAGKSFTIGRYGHIASNLEMGDYVMVAGYVSFVGGDHRIDGIGDTPMRLSGIDNFETTYIHDNVWIGHGSIIMAGVTIGKGSVIAAGSIVTKDVPAHTIVSNPYAQTIRKRRL